MDRYDNQINLDDQWIQEACDKIIDDFQKAAEISIRKLTEMFPEYFTKDNREAGEQIFFHAFVYCGMCNLSSYFDRDTDAKKVREYMSKRFAANTFSYNLIKEISDANTRWDEPL